MPTLKTDYHVDKGQLQLSVTIGEAQLGSSLVKVEDKILAKGDEISNLPIGNGPDLKGKILTVKSVVTDVNDKTNHTSVTYQLKGGVQGTEYYLEGTVNNEGDSIIYRATIRLI